MQQTGSDNGLRWHLVNYQRVNGDGATQRVKALSPQAAEEYARRCDPNYGTTNHSTPTGEPQ